MMIISAYFILVGIILISFTRVRLKIFGKMSNPFGFFIIINFFLISLPGVLIVYSGQYGTLLNEGVFSVDRSVIDTVTYAYLYSVAVIFLSTMLASVIFSGFDVNHTALFSLEKEPPLLMFGLVSTVVSIIYLAVLFNKIGINNIPMYWAIIGDLPQAATLKAGLIRGDIVKISESANQFFKILIPLTSYILFNRILSRQSSYRYKAIFFVSVFVAFGFYSYELHKAPFMLFLLGLIFLYMTHRGLRKRIIFFILLVFILLVIINMIYFEIDWNNLNLALEKVFTRLIIMQNQGMYFIVDMIEPDLERLKNGMLFGSYIFDDIPQRADAIVMESLYGSVESNVNMNTYFLGEAYSSMGLIGLAVSPFIIATQLIVYLVLFKILIRRHYDFFFPLSLVVFIFFIPINQNFNSFLYLRNFTFVVVFSSLIFVLYYFLIKAKKV
jgi:hypothetical protein